MSINSPCICIWVVTTFVLCLPCKSDHCDAQAAEEGAKAALSSASSKDKEVVQMEAQLQQHR